MTPLRHVTAGLSDPSFPGNDRTTRSTSVKSGPWRCADFFGCAETSWAAEGNERHVHP